MYNAFPMRAGRYWKWAVTENKWQECTSHQGWLDSHWGPFILRNVDWSWSGLIRENEAWVDMMEMSWRCRGKKGCFDVSLRKQTKSLGPQYESYDESKNIPRHGLTLRDIVRRDFSNRLIHLAQRKRCCMSALAENEISEVWNANCEFRNPLNMGSDYSRCHEYLAWYVHTKLIEYVCGLGTGFNGQESWGRIDHDRTLMAPAKLGFWFWNVCDRLITSQVKLIMDSR